MFADETVDHTVRRWLLALATGLLAVPILVVAVAVTLLVGLSWPVALLVSVLIAASGAFVLVWRRALVADRRVLAAIGPCEIVADDPTEPNSARFRNLADGLCLSIGVAEPELRILNSEALNAMAVAAGGTQTVVMTRALLEQLDRLELEGVVAELLIRLRNGDAERSTLVAAIFGQPMVEGHLAGLFEPVTSFVYDRVIDRHRDIAADVQAVGITRYPPGLRSGLEHIARAHAGGGAGGAASDLNKTVPSGVGPGLDHLWIVPPGRARRLFEFAPLDWRIEVLLEI